MAEDWDKYAVKTEEDPWEQFAAAPVGDTTPYKSEQQPRTFTGYFAPPKGIDIPKIDPVSQNDRAAADAGVNIDTKLNYSDSVTSWLAANPEERDAFIAESVKAQYQLGDTDIRRGPQSGKVEFFNPTTNRWTVAEPAAFSNLPGALEEGLSIVGGVLGAIGGSAAGPAGTISGGAGGTLVGRATGSVIRDQWSKALGLSKDLTGFESINNALGEGLWDANAALIGDAIYGAGRGAKTWIFGREILKPAEAEALVQAQKRAERLVREINTGSGTDLFKPTHAQVGRGVVVGDKAIGEELFTKQGQIETDPRVGGLLAAHQDASERALQLYFENETLPFRLGGVDTSAEGGAGLKRAIADEKFNATQAPTAELDAAQRGAARSLYGIQRGDPQQTGAMIRERILTKYNEATAKTRDAYKEYEDLIQINPEDGTSAIKVPFSGEVRQLNARIGMEAERALLTGQSNATKELVLKSEDGDFVDLADIDKLLKSLRSDLRKDSKNKLGYSMDSTNARKLESALEKMRNDYLEENHPDVLDALTKAERAQIEESAAFGDGLMRSLLVKDQGVYKLSDAKVVRAILVNRDPKAAKQISDILRTDPAAMVEAQNFLMALYRSQVAKDPNKLIPDYAKHKKFVENYGGVLREFFGDKQMDQLRQIGGMSEVIKKNTDNLKSLNSMWAKDFKGKIERLSSEELVNGVLADKFSIAEINKLKHIAGVYGPDVVEGWKAGVAEDVRRRIFDGDYIRPEGLQKLVDDPNMLARLNAVFGASYSKSLQTLNEAAKLIRQSPRSQVLPSKNTGYSDAARVLYAPPLSREGVALSAGVRSRERQRSTKIYNALTSAEELARLTNRTKRTIRNLKIAQTTGVSVQALMSEEDFSD